MNIARSLLLIILLILGSQLLGVHDASAATIGRPMNNDGLIGYWSFDVPAGDGTYIPDKSGNGNTGILTNATGIENWVEGRIGGGLILGDTGGHVQISTTDLPTNDFTYSMWAKLSAVNSEALLMAPFDGSGGNELLLHVLGGTFNVNLNAGNDIASGGSISIDTWTHITLSREGPAIILYIDGVSVAEGSDSATLNFTCNLLLIGADQDNDGCNTSLGDYTNGIIDEVRVFNRALSAGEIERLYNLSGPKLGKTPTVISDGLVGHWTFDGSELTTSRATNAAGSGNNGTLVNGPTPVLGTIGQALEFNGSSQYIGSIGDIGDDTGNLSVAAWVNGNDFTAGVIETIASKEQPSGSNNSFVLRVGDVGIGTDQLQWGIVQSNGTERKLNSAVLEEGIWYHIIATYNTSGEQKVYINGAEANSQATANGTLRNNATSFEIGRSFSDSGRVWDGLLDDVRLYNKELSADEVARIYNATRPSGVNLTRTTDSLQEGLVGHWTFDGPQLSSAAAYDSSITGLSGTLTNSPQPVIGKIGQALEFNGANRVQIADNAANDFTSEVTFSAWIYPTASHDGRHSIVAKWFTPSTRPYEFGYDSNCSNNYLAMRVKADNTVCGTSAIPQNVWSHVAGTYNSGSIILYLNGEVTGSGSPVSGNLETNNNTVGIGAFNDNGVWTGYFTGKIDDVRTYNRVLSTDEIKRLYNLGR